MVAVTEMTNLAIDLIDVRKRYGRVEALKGVNIQVGRGEIFGLLGPNGAGKSTLVKIMMTVVKPDQIIGTILGRPVGHLGKRAVMGYLPEDHRFPGYLKGRQLLEFYAALAKVPRARRKKNAEELLERVGMSEWANTRVRNYSKGMLQRLGIAQALMNDPELVVLDEPTDGLDPVGRKGVREMLLGLKAKGTTVFLNSHLLSELEFVCDRVAIMNKGLVVRQGVLSELTETTIEYRILVKGDLTPLSERIQHAGATISPQTVHVPAKDLSKVNQIIDLLRQNGILIESIQPKRLTLEDIFVQALGLPGLDEDHQPTAEPASGQREGA